MAFLGDRTHETFSGIVPAHGSIASGGRGDGPHDATHRGNASFPPSAVYPQGTAAGATEFTRALEERILRRLTPVKSGRPRKPLVDERQ
jgi:hypothetical protein